jgi:DDE superfamily endonuclease
VKDLVIERMWGRSLARWSDATLKYGLSQRQLTDIFDSKLNIIKGMRDIWGNFATHLEDKHLRTSKWENEFSTSRLVMWDNTNVLLCFMPTDAEAQRNTYSAYYGGNVGKGGVFIQPCGWMGTHELWVGSVSDTEYMLKSKAFEMQQQYIEERDPLSSHVPWLNMFDKGYRNIGGHAHQTGGQLVVQPNFAKSDERFNTYQTLRSASVAKIRAGNERAVRTVKTCKYISNGLQANESITRLCDVWLCWGYQVNFMFRPVH